MGLISKADILGARDWVGEEIEVPEWGGSVLIRAMSGAARDAFRASMGEGESMGEEAAARARAEVSKFEAALLACTVVDEEGAPLFSLDEVDALRGKAAAVLDRLSAEALRINGMGAGAREDAAKNSEGGQNGDSGSGSPLPSESPSKKRSAK